MNIVFCADRKVLPGLHVAAYSLLERMNSSAGETRFSVFSDTLTDGDKVLLEQTLKKLSKPFSLTLCRVDASAFSGYPPLNGSLAAYYRLAVPQILDVERFLYVDADTLCDMDVSELQSLDISGFPAGWVSEAPLAHAVDRFVASQLGSNGNDFYFNSGIMLVNRVLWQTQQVTEKAMNYLAAYHPALWDQSALNYVLHRNAFTLDARFNCMSIMRKNWPFLRQPYGKIGKLVHFVDYPKPWDFMGEFVHPQYRLWRSVLDKTTMKDFRSWHATPSRKFPNTPKARTGYRKALKDRLLFAGYSFGWLRRVKGVPQR